MANIALLPLEQSDREQFIKDNQEAFNYGALEEFGRRDDHFEEDGEIISRETIENSIDGGEAYRIMQNGQPVGGVIIKVDGDRGNLEILFVSPRVHSKGIGYAAWCAVERLHPEVTVWETVTPYFEKRNIHFYVNRCGFHIVEFYNSHHPDPNDPDPAEQINEQFPDGMFRFEKRRESMNVCGQPPMALSMMKDKTEIQLCSLEHLDEYGRIYAAAFSGEPWNDPWKPEDAVIHVKELLKSKQAYGLEYVTDGKVAGFILGTSMLFHYGRTFEINDLAVDPAYQKRGIAKKLMEVLLSDLKKQGIVGIHLITAADAFLPKFYKHFGFQEEKRVILMGKDL